MKYLGSITDDKDIVNKKYVDDAMPTNVSDLANDAGYLTQHQDISGKVDKVTGKGLSTEDYTTSEKTKLAGIATGAEVNVQADWIETSTSSDAYIKNKPTKVSAFTNDSGYQTASQVATAVNGAKMLRKDVASFSSLPQTITDSRITATMEVTNIYFGTPSAITSDINWTTSAGSVTISGSISGSTTAVLYLEEGMQ